MKKFLIGLLVLLSILLIPTNQAVAETVEDSFYEGEYVPGEYITKFNGSTGRYQQMKFFRRRSDNQAVYCIELWKPLLSDHPMTGYRENQALYAGIEESTLQRIMLIAYYGYGYQNHTESKWYAITQFMIWKETSPDSNFYFTDGLNGKKISKYDNEMAEINELIQSHNNSLPSFHNQTFKVEYLEEMTITDENNVLGQFDIMGSTGLNVTKNGNQLSVHVESSGTSSILLEQRDKRFSTPTIVYIDEIGQNLLAPGSYQPISAKVNLEVPVTDVTLVKVDQDTNLSFPQGDAYLAGSMFQLIDSNGTVIASEEVSKEGNLIFKNIGYGNYTIKEIKAGTGYKLNNQGYSIHVTDSVQPITIPNQVIKNTITLVKYIKNPITGITNVEENATFYIYNQRNLLVTAITTNEQGIAETVLPYGTYKVSQQTGAKNHFFVEDFTISVTEDEVHQTIPLYNMEKSSYIKIKNVDANTKSPILEKGATFRIKNLTTNEYVKENITTNEKGVTLSYLLSSGYYQLEQVSSVEGYLVNTNAFPFEITDRNYRNMIEIIVPNDKIQNTITLTKYQQNPITGISNVERDATFSIYNQKKELVTAITTNEQGVAETVLPYGIYTVSQQTGTKNHFFIEDFIIHVTEDGLHQNIPLYNIEKTSQIKVKNVDSDTMLPILEKGATFRIKNLTTNEYVRDNDQELLLTTNNQGITTKVLLSSGYYQLEQVSSVEGYLVNTNVFPFEITDDNYQEEIEIIVPNNKIKNTIILTKYMKNPITGVSTIEANAIFSIYNQENELVKESTTDHDGVLEAVLPYGTYIVRQKTGARNHYFVEEFTISITEDGIVQNIPLYNMEKTSYIKVKNVDSDTMLPILEKGAIFRIKNLITDEYLLDNKEELLLTTDNQGIVPSILLSSGYYQLEQVSPIEGYLVNTNVFPFEITDDNYQEEIEIIVPNDKVKSSIEITRYTEYFLDSKLIYTDKNDNIKVTIFSKDNLYTKDGVKIYDKDQVVDTAYYKNGIITTDKLVLGNYYIISPIDYQIVPIILDSSDRKKIELVDQKYEFTEKKEETFVPDEKLETKPVETPDEKEEDKKPETKPVETPDEKEEDVKLEKPVEIPKEKEEESEISIIAPVDRQENNLEKNPNKDNKNENLIIVVPNTDLNQEKIWNIGYLLLLIGFILKGKQNKNDKTRINKKS